MVHRLKNTSAPLTPYRIIVADIMLIIQARTPKKEHDQRAAD